MLNQETRSFTIRRRGAQRMHGPSRAGFKGFRFAVKRIAGISRPTCQLRLRPPSRARPRASERWCRRRASLTAKPLAGIETGYSGNVMQSLCSTDVGAAPTSSNRNITSNSGRGKASAKMKSASPLPLWFVVIVGDPVP